MINLLIKEDDVKFTRDLNMDWNDDLTAFSQLTIKEREEYIRGDGDQYRFRLESFEKDDVLLDTINVSASSQEVATQLANDYFLIKYFNRIADTPASFKMTSLYTQEEAEEQNKNAELYSFMEEELCSTL